MGKLHIAIVWFQLRVASGAPDNNHHWPVFHKHPIYPRRISPVALHQLLLPQSLVVR
jgi:hypothetical protein